MALSVRAMAAALGVAKSEVHRAKQRGMPMDSAEAATAWRLAHVDPSRSVDGRIDRPSQPRPAPEVVLPAPPAPASTDPDEVAPGSDADTAEYRKARAERERTRADRERLELEQLRGKLIAVDEASRMAFTAFRSLRDALLNLPARLKDELAAEADPLRVEQVIDLELSAVLAAFDVRAATREVEDEDEDGAERPLSAVDRAGAAA